MCRLAGELCDGVFLFISPPSRYEYPMSPAHCRYLILEQGVGAAVVNFLLNAGIAALVFRDATIVPLWGQQSIAGDTIATTILLPLISCLIVTRLARGQVRAGRFDGLPWTHTSHPFLAWLPGGTFRRGLVLGAICALVAAPPMLWLLTALHIDMLSFWRFVAFKATFAAALGAVVTPVIALWAIVGAPRDRALDSAG